MNNILYKIIFLCPKSVSLDTNIQYGKEFCFVLMNT